MATSTTFHLRLTPRSTRNVVVGWEGEVLRARVSAPPLDGRANAALIKLLSRVLGIPARDVRLIRGVRGRDKTVQIHGLSDAEVRMRLTRAYVN